MTHKRLWCILVVSLRTFAPIATAHLQCARYSLGMHVPRHVFQARAPSRNSTKYRADDLCVNLVCEYCCWMLGEPHFFFRQISSFSDSFNYTCKTKKYLFVGSFNYFSYTMQIGSNWYMDTGVCDFEVAFFKANST